MIPYGRQEISQADIDAVAEVLHSDFLTQGPTVPRFEQALADYCGVKHGVAVNSATSALHIACLALDLGPGDWLWTSPNTFVASANAALYCGAKVDFVDIDPRTYNMCATRLKEKLEQSEKEGRLPKIVMPVHFAGQPCDMPEIYALSKKYGFKIIEDASHAIGAWYSGVNRSSAINASASEAAAKHSRLIKVGSCAHSHITVFSFHPVKIITTGEGGMAMTLDAGLADRMRRLRTHGITNDKSQMQPRPENEIWNYQQIELGFNYRMTDIQAALGLSQMMRLDEFVRRRHEIASSYDDAFAELNVTTPWQSPENYSSYHLYPIGIPVDKLKQKKRQAYTRFLESKIGVNLHYIPVYLQPYYKNIGFKRGYCPAAEEYFSSTLTLPIYPTLTSEAQERVVRVTSEILA